MHLSDGVLSLPIVISTSIATVGLLGYSLQGVKEREISGISLLTGAVFALSLISIPIGPSTVHPILGGLLGILLGRRAVIAFFVALLLQLFIFQHGGLSTLGANTLLTSLPALAVAWFFYKSNIKSPFLKGFLVGVLAILGTLGLLILVLYLSSPLFAEGAFSVINLLIIGHFPLMLIEGFITGFAVNYLNKVKPEILAFNKSKLGLDA